ncbi:hypothetical protein NZD88_08140 [Chryseobacterium antibioticum]|uniref:Ecotin n=1 Tax=Chryseobacterium pyrolae TaxID=2987481 RepID=A0ABT2IFS6_9FLAO|nr:ecotin family protein [Chryseobacterium pyrolae]MCT2407505.1 hypothetical protein [Chryseobacterium pyrolae]
MKKIISTFLLTSAILLNAQEKPTHPELTANTKRIDLKLPKIENEKNYKVEVRFGLEVNVSECEDPQYFTFSLQNLKYENGSPSSRNGYYSIAEDTPVEIFDVYNKDNCGKKEQTVKKIVSSQKISMDYNGDFTTTFFIPKNWTVEYRLWKIDSEFKTAK